MPWEPEHNRRSLSPHGLKAAEGHAAPGGMHDSHSVGCAPMPDGITGAPMNADPHRAGFKMPVHIAPSAARPKDEPREMAGPHSVGPHDHLHSMPHQLSSRHTR
jgi:hypothetical protein